MKEESTKSVLGQLREMGIGEILVFPLSSRSSVKSTMYTYGPEWGKTFSGSTEGSIFRVERIA